MTCPICQKEVKLEQKQGQTVVLRPCGHAIYRGTPVPPIQVKPAPKNDWLAYPFCSETRLALRAECYLPKTEAIVKAPPVAVDGPFIPIEGTVYNIVSKDNKIPYPFQMRGIRFMEEELFENPTKGGRGVLIEDEPGLGKTIQALGLIKQHMSELFPLLYICKATASVQVANETYRWIGDRPNGEWKPLVAPQILRTSKESPHFDIFDMFIISYDLLWRMPWMQDREKIPHFKTLIIDEVQQIKNEDSKRAWGVRRVAEHAKYIIELSGTPIRNRGSEFWQALWLLNPEMFRTKLSYIMSHVDYYKDKYTGKVKTGGLRDPVTFRELTKHFIIRRDRAEVMPELPPLTRTWQFHDLEETVKKAYLAAMKGFVASFDGTGDYATQSGRERSTNLLGFMSKMRHLTGLAKVGPVRDFVEDFLEGCDRKITLFVHHKDVHQMLFESLRNYCLDNNLEEPLQIVSEMSPDARGQTAIDFNTNPKKRILIASTLSAGESLNLQACSDMIMVERQWNPPNEEQAEGRFIRIGSVAEKVLATYFIAEGTIDELLLEIVEEKRGWLAVMMASSEKSPEEIEELKEKADMSESSVVKMLMERLRTKGAKRWGVR